MNVARDVTASPQQAQGSTVLVIDDDPAMLRTTEAVARQAAGECICCGDTIAGLCAVVEHRPGAVLVAAGAGPLDAWQFSLLVKEHPEFRDVRIVILSAHDDLLEQARAEAALADGVLQKPFAAEELQALLRERSGIAA